MPEDTQVAADEQQDTTTPNQDFRQSQLAQQTFAELKAAREKIAAIEQAAADKAADEKREKLEAEGNYKAALEQQKAEFDAFKTASAETLLRQKLTNELVKAGACNDMFLAGAVASYEGDESGISGYVTSLQENEANAILFGNGQQSNPGITPPGSAAPASVGKHNWTQTKADLTDPAKSQAASQAITEYFTANGKMPPGFD